MQEVMNDKFKLHKWPKTHLNFVRLDKWYCATTAATHVSRGGCSSPQFCSVPLLQDEAELTCTLLRGTN